MENNKLKTKIELNSDQIKHNTSQDLCSQPDKEKVDSQEFHSN